LGAPLEFSEVRYNSSELTSMCDESIWTKEGYNSFCIKPGQWTDDTAMALCLVDTLLCCGKLDAIDFRQRIWLWHKYGYNNAFGRDANNESRGSIGLGGNMSLSICEWENGSERAPHTSAGNEFTNGNGSVIRNGAVPVWFRGDIEQGMKAAYQQSKATHGGEEAAELCRLLTFVCTEFINGAGRELLDDISSFKSPLYTVECLANARCEEPHPHNAHPVFGRVENRRWNWKSPDYRYCTSRVRQDPTYIGSYAMDCMSMALHCVYSTTSFEEATLKAANLCGDSDSVCAVVGQLAGALYGASSIPHDWLCCLQQWDGGSIAARALMLHDHEQLGQDIALSDAACDTAFRLGTTVGSERAISRQPGGTSS